MRLLLVDDHSLFRRGLELLVSDLIPGAVTVHCGSRQELEAYLEGNGKSVFDLILLDLNMPGFFGLESLQYVRRTAPLTPVLVFSGDERAEIAQACLQGGASGFISKAAPGAEQAETLGRFLLKGSMNPSEVAGSIGQHTIEPLSATSHGAPHLTERQRSVLRLAVQGKTNKMIGRELGISDGTVKTHLANLMAIFSVNTRTQLVFEMARQGLQLEGLHTSVKVERPS